MAYTWGTHRDGRPDRNGKTGRNGKSDEERTAEVERLTEQLHTKVLELSSSEAWVRMLWVAGRFHRYSWRNQLLLWGQAEDRGLTITRVAGYRRWAELGQQVMKAPRRSGSWRRSSDGSRRRKPTSSRLRAGGRSTAPVGP